jgi:hypothetical protein
LPQIYIKYLYLNPLPVLQKKKLKKKNNVHSKNFPWQGHPSHSISKYPDIQQSPRTDGIPI